MGTVVSESRQCLIRDGDGASKLYCADVTLKPKGVVFTLGCGGAGVVRDGERRIGRRESRHLETGEAPVETC